MSKIASNVQLLSYTPNPLSLIYSAFRQCYHNGYVGDMWEKLVSGDISLEEQAKFVAKIMESGHTSPIEHVSFSFAIEGISRALSHQLVRHRIASYSQQSQRYVDGSDFTYITPPSIANNEQAKACFEACMANIAHTYKQLKSILEEQGAKGSKANEDARFVLPQAAQTRIVVTMNCRSLLNFFQHRLCMRAQWEIRALAKQMLDLCSGVLPEIFLVAGPLCKNLGYCPEGEKFSCGLYPTLEKNNK